MLKGRDALIIIVAIFIVGILIIFFMSINKESDKLYKNLFNKQGINQSTETPSQANESQETNGGESGGSSGTGGGSNDGGSSSSTSSRNCISEEITYSMLDFNKTEICNQYEGEVCTNKIVYCTIEIQNRDTLRGHFEVKLSFMEMDKEESESFDSKTRSFYLEPNEKYIFEDSTQIESLGEDGLANKKIKCLYTNPILPAKEVCE